MIQLNFKVEIIFSVLAGIFLFMALYKLTCKALPNQSNQEQWIWKAIILLKLFCGIVFAYIHVSKYPFSDTLLYNDFSIYLNKMPGGFLGNVYNLRVQNGADFYAYLDQQKYPLLFREGFVKHPQNLLVIFNAILNKLVMNSLFAKNLIYSAIGFIGLLFLYRFAAKRYASIDRRYLLISFFVFPSLLFWSSGVLKEAPTILGIGLSIYYFEEIFMHRHTNWKNITLLALGLLLCFLIKSFMFILLLICFTVYLVLKYFYAIPFTKSNILRQLPLVMVPLAILYFVLSSGSLGNYQLEKVLPAANKLYENISVHGNTMAGSAYELPYVPSTLGGIMRMIPVAINLCLFRPYFTEASSLVTKVAALESLLLLLISAWAFYKIIFRKKWKLLFRDPFLLASLLMCLIYFFFIGISSANFGTLVRYKILVMPFYLLSLVVVLFGKEETDAI